MVAIPHFNEPPHDTQDLIDPKFDKHSFIVVREDGGGLVEKYAWFVMKYNERGDKLEVRIKGSCRSACTLALGVTNVCVYPTARVAWHHAYDYDTGAIDVHFDQMMLAAIPPRIAAQVNGKLSREFTDAATLTGVDLIKLGVKECQDD
jgi:hypothetical protein